MGIVIRLDSEFSAVAVEELHSESTQSSDTCVIRGASSERDHDPAAALLERVADQLACSVGRGMLGIQSVSGHQSDAGSG